MSARMTDAGRREEGGRVRGERGKQCASNAISRANDAAKEVGESQDDGVDQREREREKARGMKTDFPFGQKGLDCE